jgi:hypothetical protein
MARPEQTFVSYSRKDKDIVIPLVQNDRTLRWAAYIDSEHTGFGENWKTEHEEAIAKSDLFLLCWSKSASESPHVEREWRLALDFDIWMRPVLLDGTPLPPELEHINAIDLREYVDMCKGPSQPFWGLTGMFIFGASSAAIVSQIVTVFYSEFSAGRVLGFLILLVLAAIGFTMFVRWWNWQKLVRFVNECVTRDLHYQLRKGADTDQT